MSSMALMRVREIRRRVTVRAPVASPGRRRSNNLLKIRGKRKNRQCRVLNPRSHALRGNANVGRSAAVDAGASKYPLPRRPWGRAPPEGPAYRFLGHGRLATDASGLVAGGLSLPCFGSEAAKAPRI